MGGLTRLWGLAGSRAMKLQSSDCFSRGRAPNDANATNLVNWACEQSA
jgi:hypothetical protein